MRGLVAWAALLWAVAMAPLPVMADTLLCATPQEQFTAAQADRLLTLAAAVTQALDDLQAPVALVSRSGLRLNWLGHSMSHAGVVRQGGHPATQRPATPHPAPVHPEPEPSAPPGQWVVRQLYLDCDQGQARVFDEGLPAFVMGVAQAQQARIHVTAWPAGSEAEAQALAGAHDAHLAHRMVGRYSANAHAWSQQFQNCNQWVAEWMAAVFGHAHSRRQAQEWLTLQDYTPSVVQLPGASWLPSVVWRPVLASLPHLSAQDHPETDLAAGQLRTSLPTALEGFMARQWPGVRKIQLCLTPQRLVIRRGEADLPADCEPAPDDEVQNLSF